MKSIIGLTLIVVGVAIGIGGWWWGIIGGTEAIINDFRAELVDVALYIVRILFAGFIGLSTAVVTIVIGLSMLED